MAVVWTRCWLQRCRRAHPPTRSQNRKNSDYKSTQARRFTRRRKGFKKLRALASSRSVFLEEQAPVRELQKPSFSSRRSPVFGRGGMVAASQPMAVAAGIEILSNGGNAADAAVAVAAALNVTEPTSTGIGGDMFALFFDAKTQKVSALNGSGRAPAALTLERLKKEGLNELPPFHAYTVTVPGACAGWCDLIEKHGTKTMAEILAPAIKLAEEGFPVAPITSYFWGRGAQRQLASALNGRELTVDGRGPNAGEIFKNPGLARTFQKIAEGGKKSFYEGEIAEAIAAVLKQAGGCLTTDDLAAHVSTWET